MHGSVDFLISCRAVICVRVCLLRSCCTAVKINYFLWLSELPATRNWCSLGAAFGGSFGMGRGLPNSPSAQTQQPFSCSFSHRPCSSLRKAFALNSEWLLILHFPDRLILWCRYLGDCVVIPGLTGYLDSRSGSGMTAFMCNVLLAVATREWLLGFVP